MSDKKNSLERYVVEKLLPIDPHARPTRGSGCGNESCDISNKYFYIECISGDTIIHKIAGGKMPSHDTIKNLYNYSLTKHNASQTYINKKGKKKVYRYKSNKSWWERYQMPQIYSLDLKKDIIIPNRIKNIYYSGKKLTYKLTTRLGFSIKATKEHKFWTNNGWKKLENLEIGDCVAIKDWNIYSYRKKLLPRNIVELHIRIKKLGKCKKCNHKKCLEIHHKDGNFLNNKKSNLEILCSDCHRKFKKGKYHKNKIKNYYFDSIKKIIKYKIEDCYDIEMEGSEKTANYGANEFIVHNCKQKLTKDNIIIDYKKEWLKSLADMPVNTFKPLLIVTENKQGEKFVTLSVDDFFELVYEAKNES